MRFWPAFCTLSVRRSPARRLFAAGLLLIPGSLGCVTPFERDVLLDDNRPQIDNVQGPTERRLRNPWSKDATQTSEVGVDGSLKPLAGTDEYLAAKELYDAGEFAKAEEAFKSIAKHKKLKKARSSIREDAMFMRGEAAYEQNKLAKAHDYYAEVLRDYPSTRHLDTISRRLFKIATVWLNEPEVVGVDEIKQVDFEQPEVKKPAPNPTKNPSGLVFVPNLIDETRPLFDTPGNAVAALRAIWVNDPTGPLADDAIMLAASYYARAEDWIEADRMFTLLREQFPQSPHVQTAFELGSHVKLMSYQGPEYDGKNLDDAEQLKRSLAQLYPGADRERIETELAKIQSARAARLWAEVELYEKKDRPRSVSVYCFLILQQFPDTPYADRAREKLRQLGPEYATGAALRSPEPDPKRTIWGTLTNSNPESMRRAPVAGGPPQIEASEEPLEPRGVEMDFNEAHPPEEKPARRFWPFSPPRPLTPDSNAKEIRIESAETEKRNWNPFRRSEVEPVSNEEAGSTDLDADF